MKYDYFCSEEMVFFRISIKIPSPWKTAVEVADVTAVTLRSVYQDLQN